MIEFIKNYSLRNIRNKLAIIYVLNVTDIIFTLFLLNTGLYTEVNIIISKAIKTPIAGFFLKIILPGILFIFIYFRMKTATDKQLKQSNFIINGAIVLYSLINSFHILCFSLLLLIPLIF